ncbi:hypothetical protein Aazo_3067 ['Nostoc azollae' 0708]|jgi:hypothetical protein|uniref:Uncharacterized protein n=1 Tax=Nostoc azollae (strain 0708) TaxID=551115 RepID=D7E1Q8_NOSA0|nr:hypothetical protein [Trichormus azollae]ADI64829.1 hypothetical protein Aazo_3067 ['Nostoc azollae' 0708]
MFWWWVYFRWTGNAISYILDHIPQYHTPPAVATSLSFALKAGNLSNLLLFAWALGITAILVVLERYALWLLTHYTSDRE